MSLIVSGKAYIFMNIVIALIALALSGYTAFSFWKAGYFKATADRATLLGAGFGWVEPISTGLVRVIAWLEILGAVAVVIAPLAAFFIPGAGISQWIGVAAAAGLALTMVGAAIVHIARGEFAYTWKMNVSLFAVAVAAGVAQAFVSVPLFS